MNNSILCLSKSDGHWPGNPVYINSFYEGLDNLYALAGGFSPNRISRKMMAKVLSNISRYNVYPSCKFIPVKTD